MTLLDKYSPVLFTIIGILIGAWANGHWQIKKHKIEMNDKAKKEQARLCVQYARNIYWLIAHNDRYATNMAIYHYLVKQGNTTELIDIRKLEQNVASSSNELNTVLTELRFFCPNGIIKEAVQLKEYTNTILQIVFDNALKKIESDPSIIHKMRDGLVKGYDAAEADNHVKKFIETVKRECTF